MAANGAAAHHHNGHLTVAVQAIHKEAAADSPTTSPQRIACVCSGLDNVVSYLDNGTAASDSGLQAPLLSLSWAGSGSSMSRPGWWQRTAAHLEHSGALGRATVRMFQVAFLVAPFFLWGTSMPMMKAIMARTTPLTLSALRLLPSGIILVVFAALTGRRHPCTAAAWGWVVVFALVDAAAFQGFLALGLTRTAAGLGSIIIDSQPLSVALMASVLFKERLGAVGALGLVMGVVGLGLLEVPLEAIQEAYRDVMSGTWRPSVPNFSKLPQCGEFWMFLAAQSMAVGTILVRFVTKHVDPIMATGWHMVLGGALLTGAAVAEALASPAAPGLPPPAPTHAAGFPAPAHWHASGCSPHWHTGLAGLLGNLTPSDWLAMVYVSLLGGAASYGIFFYNATRGSLTALSSLTFLTPVFANAAGYLLLGETLTGMQLVGGVVTLSSVMLINHQPAEAGGADEEEVLDAVGPLSAERGGSWQLGGSMTRRAGSGSGGGGTPRFKRTVSKSISHARVWHVRDESDGEGDSTSGR